MRLSGLFWSRKFEEPHHEETYTNLFPKQRPSEGEAIPAGPTHTTGLRDQTKTCGNRGSQVLTRLKHNPSRGHTNPSQT